MAIIPTKPGLYKGYSTFEFQRNKSLGIRDVELVKLDLLNHIFTRYGERVMMQNFGSIVPDIVFEPLDEETVETIKADIVRIINFDPRVDLLDIVVFPDFDQGSVRVAVKVEYIELRIVDTIDFNIQFEGAQ